MGAPMSATGAYLNNQAQESAKHAGKQDAHAEAQRQQDLQRKNLDLFGDSLGSFNSAAQQPQKAADAREAQIADALSKAGPGLQFNFAGAGNPVAGPMGQEINDRANFGSAQVGRKAAISGYGDAALNRNLTINRNDLDTGMNNYIGQRSANTLGMELDADQSKAYSPLGDFLVGLGGATNNLMAMGMGMPAGTPKPTVTSTGNERAAYG